MALLNMLLVSGGIGAAMGATVFFAKEEPYKFEIVIGSFLRNLLVGLLIVLSSTRWFSDPGLPELAGWGALFGFWTILIVFVSKGRDHFKTHIPIIIFGTVTGALTGVALYFMQ